MQVTKTDIPGVLVIEPEVHRDARGYFKEFYRADVFAAAGITVIFVQDNFSHSTRNVLRGLHYQLRHPQAKLISVLNGEVLDVVLDIRMGSPAFGQWSAVRLSGENQLQLFIPEGVAHGFCVLSERVDFFYKNTDFYAAGDEYGVLWNDPSLNIDWPVSHPVVSAKDVCLPRLADIPREHMPIFGG